MTLRTCTVSCEDSDGHQYSLEVTAETLYEAVAQGLAAFKSHEKTASKKWLAVNQI
jgi:hypothetical protein